MTLGISVVRSAPRMNGALLAMKPKFRIKVTGVQSADGNIALTQAKWSVNGTDADGKPVTMSGRSAR
jgi:ketosteroid isomerase-like protein